MWLYHLAIISQCAIGLNHLQRGYRDTLSDRHSGHIQRAHLLRVKQNTCPFPWQLNACRFAKSKGFRVGRERFASCKKANVCKTGIDGKLKDIHQPYIPIGLLIPVSDRMSIGPDSPGIVPYPGRIIRTCRQGGSRYNRLKRRTRFINVYYGLISELGWLCLVEIIRIIGRTAGHSQNRSGLRIHHNNQSALCLCRSHGPVQSALSEILNILINSQIYGFPLRRHIRRHRGTKDRNSTDIRYQNLFILAATDFLIKGHFQSIQPFIIPSYKAQYIGQHLIIGVIPPAFIYKPESLQMMLVYKLFCRFTVFRIHNALKPDKMRIL